MCGILAYYTNTCLTHDTLTKVKRSLQSINHRGPDGEGLLLINTQTLEKTFVKTEDTPKDVKGLTINEINIKNYNLAFGHKRLSIFDLSSAGHQPMLCNVTGNVIVFNGEIYNWIEIKEELLKEGYRFYTATDTEVILAAYNKWGEKCVKKFNGMWAFIIFNATTKHLFISNDRFGVKPLYQFVTNELAVFASEVKQFKAFDFNLTPNEEAITNYLTTSYTDVGDTTFYNEVKRFPKSSFAHFKMEGALTSNPNLFYELPTQTSVSTSGIEEKFVELLTSAVTLRMRSDVPVGFASSGGLDSSAILYTAYHQLSGKNKLNTFSAVFPNMQGDEFHFINIANSAIDINAHTINPYTEFTIADFEKNLNHLDLPVSSTSFYAMWCVAKLVNKSNVKVLLVGQGADEILAGYHHHFYRYCRELIYKGKIKTYLNEVKCYAEIKGQKPNYFHKIVLVDIRTSLMLKLGLKKISNTLEKDWNNAETLFKLLKIDLMQAMFPMYVRSDDRSAMAFGIETRHPFLDYRLVDFCLGLPNEYKIKDGWQKNLIRQTITSMPNEIRFRKDKKGFTTPQDLFLTKYKEEFDNALSYLPSQYLKSNAPIFNKYCLGFWYKNNKL